jgi:hypothetical protein
MKTLIITAGFGCAFFLGANLAFIVAQPNYAEAEPATKSVGVTVSVGTPLEYSAHNETMQVRWVSDTKAVREVLDEYFAQTGILATGLTMNIGSSSVIYAFEPKYENDRAMQILGHECLHVFRGTWHE